MQGGYRIVIHDKRIKYDFYIRRNITIIKGKSATGKTQLIEMISAYESGGLDSGVDLQCDVNCVVLRKERWKENLKAINESIIFIDEGNAFVISQEFAEAVADSDNYFVIVTREKLYNLPYSVNEIYGIRVSKKYSGLKQVYNEFYRIYEDNIDEDLSNTSVLVEDSNSGYQFWNHICNNSSTECYSANGKSNICGIIEKSEDKNYLIIADGAAFGSEMERLDGLKKSGHKIVAFLPESFEWLILNSGIIKDSEIELILKEPEKYVLSEKYISWERYFTDLLMEKSKDTYLAYKKSKLNENYLKDNIVEIIMEKIPERVKEVIGLL